MTTLSGLAIWEGEWAKPGVEGLARFQFLVPLMPRNLTGDSCARATSGAPFPATDAPA